MSEPPRPARSAPANLRSLLDRLRNAARDADLPEGRLIRQLGSYAVAEMLTRVTDESGESLFLIKGGTSIEMRLGVGQSRASKDLDAAFRGGFESMYAAASDALAAAGAASTRACFHRPGSRTPPPQSNRSGSR